MIHTATAPVNRPTPLLARLLCPPGPAKDQLIIDGDDGVFAVAGRYCVTYLILAPGRVAVVDCGSAADLPLIRRALARLGRAPAEVCFVLPTHLHFDHVMGVDLLARSLKTPVALGTTSLAHVRDGHPLRFPSGLTALRSLATWPMQGMPVFTADDWRGGLDFGFPSCPNTAPPCPNSPAGPCWRRRATPTTPCACTTLARAGSLPATPCATSWAASGTPWCAIKSPTNVPARASPPSTSAASSPATAPPSPLPTVWPPSPKDPGGNPRTRRTPGPWDPRTPGPQDGRVRDGS